MKAEKVAIVTASSRGIGAGCARQLAKQGYTVALLARSASVLDLAESLGGFGMQGSVGSEQDIESLVNTTLDRYGRIDAVVNSAYDPPRPDLLSISDELWQEIFSLLFLSVVRVARYVTEPMIKAGGGVIVNISAADSHEPDPGTPFSGTIRTAMEGFTKMYSKQYATHGIRMISVAPYFVGDSMEEFDGWDVPSDLIWGRPPRYEEFAKVINFLVSDDAKYISGTTIKIDGAWSKAI
ncbi:SDR family oxidoreductase [Nostoc sphaeroides]|uniref:Dehydrogenase reductase n=1 Tax=Nostoc sphaeroides CCNUC1 TaxID=2653204 RepID=A0A5P8WI28_9NOSO|nr:SDR family oxidoreductase [Nostoc sphaeroides]QFS52523.1 Dehydrogenase reductase [Nostoc sphaeroides CCNUC1]